MSKKKFASKEALEDKLARYFEQCNIRHEMPNVAGFCVFMDMSRETYYEYAKKYPDTIKRARMFIENAWVNRLSELSPTGAIFYLKNAFREDYKDRHETDVTSGGEPIPLFDYVTNKNARRENNSNPEDKKPE